MKLSKWQKGLLKNEDLYIFLASRVNEIPSHIINNGSDEDAINYCIKNAVVKTNPHNSINFHSRLPHDRIEHRQRLKKAKLI